MSTVAAQAVAPETNLEQPIIDVPTSAPRTQSAEPSKKPACGPGVAHSIVLVRVPASARCLTGTDRCYTVSHASLG